jgi:hypothetical protein
MKRVNFINELVKLKIQSMPKGSKYLTRAEIRLRIEVQASLCPPKKNALRG